MIEKIISLDLPPGISKNGTKYQAKNRWYASNLVRWYEKKIMGPIGGWRAVRKVSDQTPVTVTGMPRAMHGWKANDSISHLAVGTHTKLWHYIDGAVNDITPAGMPGSPPVDGTFVFGNFGSGAFGGGNYGTGSGALSYVSPATWQLDNFGELLVACHSVDGRLLQAAAGGGVATVVSAGAPVSNIGLVVTPEHFLVALGAGGNARRVSWPDQESLTLWTPADTNQAGSFDLPTKGRLVTGRRTRRQTILWTDIDVYGMTYVGGNEVYAFESLGDNCGLISPQAPVVLGDRMFWMSFGKFFEYDGALKPIPCDVLDHVFNELDQSQRAKVHAVPMTLFNEVWWFYPSKNRATYECDKAVAYNFQEGIWMLHDLPRGCGIDRGVYEYPIMVANDDLTIYEHEYADTRVANAYAETGPLELGEGDQLMRVQQIIPDEKTQGDVTMTLYGALFPNSVEQVNGPFTATNPTATRMTARQIRFRVDEVTKTNWRVGVPRLGVIPAGGR